MSVINKKQRNFKLTVPLAGPHDTLLLVATSPLTQTRKSWFLLDTVPTSNTENEMRSTPLDTSTAWDEGESSGGAKLTKKENQSSSNTEER